MIDFNPVIPLTVSGILFFLGAIGVLLKRNPVVILMFVELMLNAVNLAFVTYSRMYQDLDGQIFVIITMVVAASEVAVGLAIIVALFRHKKEVDVDDFNLLKR